MIGTMQVEPSINDIYAAYQVTPSQDNLSAVVGALKPTISYALGSVGASNDPLVKSKAMIYTARAVKKYDPKFGASLPTFVSNQLRQLSRTARQSRSVMNLPERIQLDSFHLSQSQKEFEAKHGREPDTLELADHSGLPVKRIEKIRKYAYATPSEASMPEDPSKSSSDFTSEALDYVYNEADHIDRRILEMKVGYGGHPTMTPQAVAAKLRLTPSQLSRRSSKLVHKLNELQEALETV